MIQEVWIGKDNIHTGRFVLELRKIGLGLGKEATEKLYCIVVFLRRIKEDINLNYNGFIETGNIKKAYLQGLRLE
ncbi:hypothetical protein HMPREF9333_01762 [Johnsonella ignava ATCC 51276]|uniref:Uncharacterized protein n=1 Tax=Johnsonella ignava ATCC 51276 TaxID=679200 RepID=G5GJM2_9FIRM|nr:hypothetical protein [Johnsonella ignava]EHI55043.1 hypothetical protein HMPREF9333_01762 [Johnsonella ignava ATCC 51276]